MRVMVYTNKDQAPKTPRPKDSLRGRAFSRFVLLSKHNVRSVIVAGVSSERIAVYNAAQYFLVLVACKPWL